MLLLLPLLLALVTGAPLLGDDYSGRIPDEYIVIYKKETVNDVIFAHQADLSLNIKHTYNISNDFRGFSAHFTTEELSKVLQTPFVEKVYCNGHVHAFCDIRQSPSTSWGLSRVSSQGCLTAPLTYDYAHHPNPGQNTNIYILDTGTKADHEQFNGRVAPGANFMPGEPPATVDENGHGTHCAGTAAGNTFGIARNARIIPVKVLGRTGGGSFEGVIAGIDWSANDYNQPNKVPSVASMSLGATSNGGMNEAVEAAVRSGLPFAIAAGNSAADACNYFPASAEGCMTVGASSLGPDDIEDIPAYFSNYGRCVECWAPGVDIPSSYIPNSNSYAVLSGTSMACPHVAGLSAFILGTQRNLTPPQLMAEIDKIANKDCIQNLDPASPNTLISNGCAH